MYGDTDAICLETMEPLENHADPLGSLIIFDPLGLVCRYVCREISTEGMKNAGSARIRVRFRTDPTGSFGPCTCPLGLF